MPKYKSCECCGEPIITPSSLMPELCTPCWYIPNHIPANQYERYYRIQKIEKSEHKKKMLLLRQADR